MITKLKIPFSGVTVACLALATICLPWATPKPVYAEEGQEAAIEWAEPARLASSSLLLDAAQTGQRTIAVGERGHILVSEDKGRTWVQARVPTRSLLTSVTMVDSKLAWAAGHDAVILHSKDGGMTWKRQYFAPDLESPLLDIWFENASHGLAVGAYGLVLETHDSGSTWTQRFIDEQERHWNAITSSPDGTVYVAAEFGTIFRSRDQGKNWDALTTPYAGSFFGALPLSDGALLIFGLRGNIYLTIDQGDSWRQIATDTTVSLMKGLELPDNKVIIAGLSGTLLISTDKSMSFKTVNRPDRKGISALLPADSQKLLLFGEGGINQDSIPSSH